MSKNPSSSDLRISEYYPDGNRVTRTGIAPTEPSKDVSGVTIAEIKTIGETHPDGNRATRRAQPTEKPKASDEFEEVVDREFEHLNVTCEVARHDIITAHRSAVEVAVQEARIDELERLIALAPDNHVSNIVVTHGRNRLSQLQHPIPEESNGTPQA